MQRAQEYKTGKIGEPTELQLKAALAAVLLKTAVASAEDSLSIAEYEGYTWLRRVIAEEGDVKFHGSMPTHSLAAPTWP